MEPEAATEEWAAATAELEAATGEWNDDTAESQAAIADGNNAKAAEVADADADDTRTSVALRETQAHDSAWTGMTSWAEVIYLPQGQRPRSRLSPLHLLPIHLRP